MDIESLAFGAKGVARYEDFVVFVDGALPGQKVLAKIIKKKKNHAEARLQKVIRQSPDYREPVCVHFHECGGCSLQHYQYKKQLKVKEEQVGETLQRLGGLNSFELIPALPSVEIFHYRNKMEFSFARQRWITEAEIAEGIHVEKNGHYLGLHAKGFFEKVIDIQTCHLVKPVVSEILAAVRDIAIDSKLPVYSTRDHEGFWRFLIIRTCHNTDDLMVNVVTSKYDEQIAEKIKSLSSHFPQITSLLYSTTANKASVAFTEQEVLLAGKNTIIEKLGRYQFEISANSFFQTNSKQAERLYDVVLDYADFTGNEIVYDLYCGAGTISLYVSDYAGQVVGFEAIESAVKDAKRNSILNGVRNCEFVLGDLRDQLLDTKDIIARYGKPDVMIIDPPRSGMHPKTVKSILYLQPERIVYVSCNPATLARDLKELAQDYQLIKVQPVDMFPHTAHIEAVAQLTRSING
ncbi:MAG: 23S rRNA (uracil(1939)-C(5))-methyltransferase RlmD [Calditrichaeota bacterium]|nr:23S rRNA (uracil(1939)-C(5))-methyltransferase RlmD [Calditrichota bacterium]